MTPNFRRQESERLASAAIATCNERLELAGLRARLDSLLSLHGLDPTGTRSHPETERALEALLERQRARPACLEASAAYRESRAIAERAPAVFELPAYAAPDSASELVGTIVIRIDQQPGEPERLVLAYRPSGADDETDWTLDRMQVDGYGSYHHTVLERRGAWLLLPADPFPVPVWIHWSGTFRSPPEVEPLFGSVYRMREREARAAGLQLPTSRDAPGVVYGRSDGRDLWFRLERPGDGPCPELRSPEEPAPSRGPASDAEWSLPVEHLFDERGHLAIDIKYSRGC